jgi:hypothetical protein
MSAPQDRAQLPRNIRGWISEHPAIDLAAAAVLLAAHVLLTRRGHGDFLAWLDTAQRQAVYGAGAGVVAVLGGLTAIALAQYRAATGDRSTALRRLYGPAVRKNWRGILLVTGLAALLCLVALATDRVNDPVSSRFIFEFAVLAWGLRFLRLIWLFDNMLAVADLDASDEPRAPAPAVHPRWSQRKQGTG